MDVQLLTKEDLTGMERKVDYLSKQMDDTSRLLKSLKDSISTADTSYVENRDHIVTEEGITYWKRKDVMDFMKISYRTVERLQKAGKLHPIRMHQKGNFLYRKDEVMSLFNGLK